MEWDEPQNRGTYDDIDKEKAIQKVCTEKGWKVRVEGEEGVRQGRVLDDR